MNREPERPLDPPEEMDYNRDEEYIEQERADAADKAVWDALNSGNPMQLLSVLRVKR